MQNIILKPYQEQIKEFIKNTAFCGVFLPPGMGKTLSTLTALFEARPEGNILVIGPKNIVRSVWIDEIEKWEFPLTYHSLIVGPRGGKLTKKKRQEAYDNVLSSPPAMYFLNQDLVKDAVDYFMKNHKVWPFKTVIIDESQGFKNPSSRRFKALNSVKPHITRLIELTGTPTPNGLKDLWSQIELISPNFNPLGQKFTHYQNTFFRVIQRANGIPVKWALNDGAEEEIYRRIIPITRSANDNILKIPDLLPINDINIFLNDNEQRMYDEFKRELVLQYLDQDGETITIDAKNAAVLSGKLLQMASGTLYIDENKSFIQTNDKKLIHLDYLLRNISDNTLIAYRFQAEKKLILDTMRAKGHQIEMFDGSPEMIKRWNNKEIKNMLIQPASSRHGLNLQQGGHTLIWYTLPHSSEYYTQTNKRLHRLGQKEPVMIHRLLTSGTIDKRMPMVLENKINAQQSLMDAVDLEINKG